MQQLAIICIRLYRSTLSYLYGNSCRFYPTCSQYALESIEKFGVWKGGWLCCKRLGRCHPWCSGGYDPVPPAN
ncbi:MAG TPA: membrane protein insertion efficiency factor YidD [Gammaproteobacteria bacterium]|nr:membrane protein insertion efficiency factor YidD [Gammaproteobacteria bacterium]